MPEISRFLGIVIKMYFNEHNPPHFHATYGGNEGVFLIETLEMIKGSLPVRIRGFVMEWADMNKEDLLKNWELLKQDKFNKIKPLV